MLSRRFVILFSFTALTLWLSASSLSGYLSGGYQREAVKKRNAPLEVPAAVLALQEQLKLNPTDVSLHMQVASVYLEEGKKHKQSAYFINGIEELQKVLELDPNHSEALLLLASLSLETGIADQAAEYYVRYLKIHPADYKARVDYSLALLQADKADTAIVNLKQVIKEQPALFQAQLALALAYSTLGLEAETRSQAAIALKVAPDDKAKTVVNSLLAHLDKAHEQTPAPHHHEHKHEHGATTSPAMAVEEFFAHHQIVGPKLSAIRWDDDKTVRVELKDFPVDKMPAFARQKFEASIKSMLQTLPEPVLVNIYDATSKQLLISVK